MNTIVLDADTSSLSVHQLLQQVKSGGVEVRDTQGKILALVLSPADHEAWTYAEAHYDLSEHRVEVERAMERQGGVTTSQLLENAMSATACKDSTQ